MSGMDDVTRLQQALTSLEERAHRQSWDTERPWRVATHVFWDRGVPTIDLHDAGAGLARRAVRAALEIAAELETGALWWITGRGRHAIGPGVLRGLVKAELYREGVLKHGRESGWSLRPAGAGRWVLITDPVRAPAVATGALGWGFWLLVAAMVAAAVWACLGIDA